MEEIPNSTNLDTLLDHLFHADVANEDWYWKNSFSLFE
jgi:hypothetical protein